MEETSYGCLSTGVQVLPVWTKVELREMQEADPNLGEVIKWLASGSLPVSCPTEANWKLQSLWVQRNFLLLEDGMLYRQWKDVEGNGLHAHLQLVLPANLVSEVLQGLHNSHVGGHLDWKIEIGLYLAITQTMHCYNVSGLNIGLFQFSSQISVTSVSVLFTPALVNPIYQQLSR